MPEQRTVEIFISHITEERDYAHLLKSCIHEDFGGQVEPFASSDIDGIEVGKDWLSSIRAAMRKAKLIVVLCSRASTARSWVNFEVGAAWIRGLPIVPFCHLGLCSKDLPAPLSFYEAAEVGRADGFAKLYSGIAEAVQGCLRPGEPKMPSAELVQQRRTEWLCFQAGKPRPRVQQFERHIDISLPPPGQLPEERFPDDARVRCGPEMLSLLGFFPDDELYWRDIERVWREKPDRRWIEELQQVAHHAANNKAFRRVQAICYTDRAAFQPELARLDVDAEGNAHFHVHMVETVVAPLFEVPGDIGLLATMLRLGLRFRFEVIDKYRHLRPDRAPGSAHADMVAEVRMAVEVIENDANSRGAQNLNDAAVLDLFTSPQDQADMGRVLDEWQSARARLFDAQQAPGPAALCAILEDLRALNYRFMCMGSKRFHEMVCTGWTPPPHQR